ncbi:MAG: phosphofructokinase [Peptococcaceae bacterium]|jgi:6-phosphofructokinase 1|nr:phosphofructokinase [Peptococcaceae bacterium]
MARLKGNLMVGQSGGPTPVINASLAGVISEAKKIPEIENIYGLFHGIEGVFTKQAYNLSKESDELINKLLYTPASILGSCRYKLKDNDYPKILEFFKANNIRYFVYIGGNDSMDTCNRISKLAQIENYEMQVVGIPKTIDNDLPYTDHCPGFGSAARFVALSTIDSGRDLECMSTFDDVAIFEVMGRHAGWLAAASALAKKVPEDAPHLIYLPERTFSMEKFLRDIKAVHQNLGYVYVIISEGIRDESGEFIGAQSAVTDAFGHKAIATGDGPGNYLAKIINKELGLKTRCNRPGTIQRSLAAVASRTDIDEAFRAGSAGVRYLAEGITDIMVTLERVQGTEYCCETGYVPLEKVANIENFMPDSFINQEGNFITDEFRKYCLPLLGDPLPEYARLIGKPFSLK